MFRLPVNIRICTSWFKFLRHSLGKTFTYRYFLGSWVWPVEWSITGIPPAQLLELSVYTSIFAMGLGGSTKQFSRRGRDFRKDEAAGEVLIGNHDWKSGIPMLSKETTPLKNRRFRR